MRKRIALPAAAAGGALLYLASQLFSLNLGVQQSDTSVIDPHATDDQRGTAKLSIDGAQPGAIDDAKLWLIDVLIDGQEYQVRRVTDRNGTEASDAADGNQLRETLDARQIAALARTASGDASGTRVRISRTPEAVAVAESELTTALAGEGIPQDAIELRKRLVE